MTLEKRLQKLEDDRAIRDLKARYLRAADAKDVASMRDCFAPDATIAFEGFPTFTKRDQFIEIYQQMACVEGIFDIHHGSNGIVTFDDDKHATGQFSLLFHNINLVAQTLTQMGVEYDDAFVKGDDDRWYITETRSRRGSALVHRVDTNGGLQVIAMGVLDSPFGGN